MRRQRNQPHEIRGFLFDAWRFARCVWWRDTRMARSAHRGSASCLEEFLARPLHSLPDTAPQQRVRGLLWGLAFSFLLWLAGPAGMLPKLTSNRAMGMLDEARSHFPELIGYLLLFGAPLGLVLGTFSGRRPSPNTQPFSLPRALVAGGLAGIVGGWAFGQWMEKAHFYPLIAGLVGSSSPELGKTLHFIIAVIIGGTFGSTVPTRCARLRIKRGLGNGVWHFLVVSRAADAQITP